MALRTTILGTACALALGSVAASPAMADVSNFSAVLGAGYSHLSIENVHANTWSFMGTGAFDTDILHNMSLQGDVGYHSTAVSQDDYYGIHESDLTLAATPFWRMDWGRVGATVGLNDDDYYGELTTHTVNYGVFAEWYICPSVTLAVKGGGWNTNFVEDYHFSSGYIGGQVTWYAMPDLALVGTVDYTGSPGGEFSEFGAETDYGISAEWLVSETTPVSIYGSWTGSSLDHVSDTVSTWSVGLKFYMNQGDASALVDRQRSGSSTWDSQYHPAAHVLEFY